MSLGKAITSKTAVKLYVILSALFIFLLIADAWIMPWIVHSRSERVIPDVTNMSFDKARHILSEAGLTIVDAGTAPSHTVQKGDIVYQNPPPGSVVREGRNVYLTTSGGEQQIIMPSLRGRSLRDAKITLERLELKPGLITYSPSELPSGSVVSQSTPPGRRISANKSIDLVISEGQAMQQIDVPYIVGLTLTDAQKTLIESGLKLGRVFYREDPNYSTNTIVAQSPSAGDKVDPNMPIDVTLVR